MVPQVANMGPQRSAQLCEHEVGMLVLQPPVCAPRNEQPQSRAPCTT